MTNLDEVERRAAKLRKVTARIVSASENREENDGDDEIDLDEVGDDDDDKSEENSKEGTNLNTGIHAVSTKALPSAVFGK